jgi:hypothetical protein
LDTSLAGLVMVGPDKVVHLHLLFLTYNWLMQGLLGVCCFARIADKFGLMLRAI